MSTEDAVEGEITGPHEHKSLQEQKPTPDENKNVDLDRRQFLTGMGQATSVALTTSMVGAAGLVGAKAVRADDDDDEDDDNDDQKGSTSRDKDGKKRRQRSFKIRKEAALKERKRAVLDHPVNGDEDLYPSRIAMFHKTLPHDMMTGEVDPAAYDALLHALSTMKFADFEAVPRLPSHFNRLANPMGAIAYNMEGSDNAAIGINPPPALASPEYAAQLAELYWMACIRDVPFSEYGTDADALAAAADLNTFSGYTGPSTGGMIQPQDLFRVNYPGISDGPLVSQFLYQSFNFDGIPVDPKIATPANAEFMTTWTQFIDVQNGGFGGGFGIPTVPGQTNYIRTARDLGKHAGSDTIYSSYFRAVLTLGFLGPTDLANPYNSSSRQFPFASFGLAHLLELIGKVHKAERHAWYQKWCVHRFHRPEGAGGLVHRIKMDDADYPIHDDLIKNSSVLDCIYDKFGSYLLPQMFGNGSPTHPSFTAGHAISAGACVTLMKAWYNEDALLPFPAVEPTPDGQMLVPYAGPALTLGGELNKLAHNLSWGRDMSGVHWRADNVEGNRQGEELAIRLLREEKATYGEDFPGFSLTKFDGTTIII